MTNTDLYVSVDELQIVLNLLGPTVHVDFPPYGQQVLEARQEADGYRLVQTVSAEEINTCFDSFKHTEFFNYQSLVECFLASGIDAYVNIDEINKEIQVKQQALPGCKELFFVLDTNLLYDRFVSMYHPISRDHVFLVDTVQHEILHHLNYKYDTKGLNNVHQLLREHSDMADAMINAVVHEWQNRNRKETRIARNMALQEYNLLRKYGKEIPAIKEHAKTSRENDEIIAETIHQFQQQSPYNEFLLLTADADMKDVCDIIGVDCLVLQKPTRITSKHCTTQQFLQLLYAITVLSGFVKLNSTLLFSEFHGGNQDFPLKMRLLNESDCDIVRQHIMLCRELKKIEKKNMEY